ncbi:hypothetical protein [Rhodopila sp.]|uniref:hypothetical protein n=1 Tax=Rhodopila sp. TaxID=2480087 RepID=UPI003D13ED30
MIITPRSSGSPIRQRLLVCIIVFTIASMLFRAAQSLPRIVAVRLLCRAVSTSALVPLSQAALLQRS